MSTQSREDFWDSETILYYNGGYMSLCTTKGEPYVSYGLWVTMRRHRLMIRTNVPLWWDVIAG